MFCRCHSFLPWTLLLVFLFVSQPLQPCLGFVLQPPLPPPRFIHATTQPSVSVSSVSSSSHSTTTTTTTTTTTLYGYKFGDITRGVLGKAKQDITKVTGKDKYEFGDLTKWLDQRAKSRVANFTNSTKYEFGDITREVIRRLKERDYTRDDIMLVLQLIAFAGLNFAPIARILPGKVLIDLLEVSIAQTVGEKVISTITTELDGRLKEMVTGDRQYQFGDMTRKAVLGKKEYEFGDLTRAAISKFTNKDNKETQGQSNTDNDDKHTVVPPDQDTLNTLEEWDKKFLATTTTTNQENASSLDAKQQLANDEIQKWDEKLRETAKQK